MDELIKKMILNTKDVFYSAGDYTDFTETIEAMDELDAFYSDDERFKDVRNELDRLIGIAQFKREEQGFYYGFKTAMDMINSPDFREFVKVQALINESE